MLNILVKSLVKLKTVAFFALNPSMLFYPNQVAQEIGEARHAVGLEIRHLVTAHVLRITRRNRRSYYQWNAQYSYADLLQKIIARMHERHEPSLADVAHLGRRERLEKNLAKILATLARDYRPEKVILYGSLVSGKVHAYSDIDLAIIKETDISFYERTQQVIDLLDYDVGVDMRVYTPQEFQEAVRSNRFFREEIQKRGKVIYDRVA